MQVREITVTHGDGSPPGTCAVIVEKRLSPRERSVPEAVRNLQRETTLLRALAAVATPPTPRVLGWGEDADGPYLHLEKVPYPTLAARIAALAPSAAIDAGWLARAARAAFGALAALHEARDERGPLAIVHADLSPANVLVDDLGTHALLLDLELAVFRDGPPRDGAFRGTARYCAPEIARGEQPGVDSDLFALAATLLHAVTGTPPRDAPSLPALLAIAAETPLVVTPALDPALAACLAHAREARPRSARAVLAALC